MVQRPCKNSRHEKGLIYLQVVLPDMVHYVVHHDGRGHGGQCEDGHVVPDGSSVVECSLGVH